MNKEISYILSHQGDINQNHTEISSHASKNGYLQMKNKKICLGYG